MLWEKLKRKAEETWGLKMEQWHLCKSAPWEAVEGLAQGKAGAGQPQGEGGPGGRRMRAWKLPQEEKGRG